VIADLQRWALSPLVGERYVFEVDVAPEALSARLRTAINKQPKRMFGVLKVSSHWVGAISGNEFAVWEKQQHATRAEGRIRGRRGGSRIEVRIGVTRRAQFLVAVLLILFFAASLGILTREGSLGLGPTGLGVAALGAVVTLTVFWSAALSQRAALRRFLNQVFREPG
jgi:hypothetical protein